MTSASPARHRYERAVVRWLGRFCLERPAVTLSELQRAVAAFRRRDRTVSGVAPTLAVVLEDTLDGTNWNTLATFSQKTAASREVVNVTTPFAERFAAALHAR